jgi:GNAT superfamily N-acetyltransferase
MSVSIRLLRANEAGLANNFFNAVYQTTRPQKNFEWEFLNGPFGKAIYVVAVDDNITTHTKIVGIQCAIPLEMISSTGVKVLTAKSEDTLVDPAYRGQKIFERMYDVLFQECRNAGIKYIWGFTPAQKAFERIGFEIPFKTEQALLVLKPLRAYAYLKSLNAQNKTKDKVKIFGLSVLSWAKGFARLFSSKSSLKKIDLPTGNRLLQKFYNDQIYFTLHETPAYINWRLTLNPFQNSYQAYSVSEGNEVIAKALFNNRRDVSYIEQIVSKPGVDISPILVRLAKEAAKSGAPLIRAFCFSTNSVLMAQATALKKAGFTYLKRGNYFVWKSLDESNAIKPEQLLISRLFTQGNL